MFNTAEFNMFIATQHKLLDNIAATVNAGEFNTATALFNTLAQNCTKLTFSAREGYTQTLVNDWLDELNTALQTQNAGDALQAQTALYEMLDVCLQ